MQKMEWKHLLCQDRIRSYQPSTVSKDLRSEFEKDYHRIIGSASFRRLQDKTQVFPLDKSDFIRTRLTHSLEVSSFARSLGQNIGERILDEQLDPTFTGTDKNAICDILQCAGLLHDIGNPPFGHFGETIIREWFEYNLPKLQFEGESIANKFTQQWRQDFYQFEGNAQALRLVSKLHFLVDENGMNLTKGLLGCLMKYPVASDKINKKSGDIKDKKMGYFYAETAIFEQIQEATGTKGCRHPLTFILEAADDVAYKTADIEDAVKKGCLSYQDLLRELVAWNQEKGSEEFQEWIANLEYRYQKGWKIGVDKPELYAVQNWVVAMQGKMILHATDQFASCYEEIMQGEYKKDLFADTPAASLMDCLGDIAYRYAFISKPIMKLEIAAESILEFLLRKFVDAVLLYDYGTEHESTHDLTQVQKKWIDLLSDNYKRIYHSYSNEKSEVEKLYLRLLLVTDTICGMTDGHAKDLYQELNGIA